jgi:hypothetical protein
MDARLEPKVSKATEESKTTIRGFLFATIILGGKSYAGRKLSGQEGLSAHPLKDRYAFLEYYYQ